MNRVSASLVALLVAVVVGARAQSAEERYVRIYNLIQQADALNRNGQFALALPKYLEAQSALQRIQKFNPEWNPKVVNYRLDYLAERIESGSSPPARPPARKISPTPATPPSIPTPPKPEAPPPAAAGNPTDIADLQNTVARLQSDKTILEAKLKEALATQPAAVDPRELSKAQEQIQSLLKENELLKSTLDAEKGRPGTPAEARKIEELKNSLTEANRKLADQSARANVLLAEQQDLRKRLDAQAASPNELAVLKQTLAEANRRLAEQTTASEKSGSEKISLQERLNQLTTRADNAEALRAENQLLKQQLAQSKAEAGTSTDEAKRRSAEAEARIAALQSDAQVLRLEKLALENRLTKSLALATIKATPNPADTQRIRQLEQERGELRQRLELATKASPAPAQKELVAKVEQLTKEVTGLRARVEVFEARAIPYSPEELALFQTDKSKVLAYTPDPERQAHRSLPAGSAALVAEAQRNFANRDYAKAEQNYLDILRQDQQNHTALANLATIQMEAGKLPDAEKSIRSALTAAPDDAYNLAIFGKIKYQEGKYDDALDALSRAAKAIPRDPEIQNYLGVTLSQKGLRGPAETALRKAIQIDPNYASAHNNLAVIYATQTPPLIELARWHYQKALAAGHARNEELEKLFNQKEAAAN